MVRVAVVGAGAWGINHVRAFSRVKGASLVVGSKKMVDFDDANPAENLRGYGEGFDRPPAFTEFSEFLQIRNGNILIPRVGAAEPLDIECRHFVECVAQGKTPLTDGASGVEVVKVLAAAQRSLDADGAPVVP